MGLRLYRVAAFGVEVSYEEAKSIYIHIFENYVKRFMADTTSWYNEFNSSPEDFKAEPLKFMDQEGVWDKYITQFNEQTGLKITEEFVTYCDYEGNRSIASYESREVMRYYAELFTMNRERFNSGTGGEWLLEGADHVYGIFLTEEVLSHASHWADQTSRYLKESELMKKQFAQHCQPVLDHLMIRKSAPKIITFNQTK